MREVRASTSNYVSTPLIGIDASGATLGDVFAAVANGLATAQRDGITETGERFTVEEQAESREVLGLFRHISFKKNEPSHSGSRPNPDTNSQSDHKNIFEGVHEIDKYRWNDATTTSSGVS